MNNLFSFSELFCYKLVMVVCWFMWIMVIRSLKGLYDKAQLMLITSFLVSVMRSCLLILISHTQLYVWPNIRRLTRRSDYLRMSKLIQMHVLNLYAYEYCYLTYSACCILTCIYNACSVNLGMSLWKKFDLENFIPIVNRVSDWLLTARSLTPLIIYNFLSVKCDENKLTILYSV